LIYYASYIKIAPPFFALLFSKVLD